MRFVLICFIFFSFVCMAQERYRVYDYRTNLSQGNGNIPTVFILDYSNSMNMRINGESKYSILKRCFQNLITQIPDETPVGVRVYGHRWGLTSLDACKATTMAEGINKYNRDIILEKIAKYRPRGMTPITYSLKETIEKDFPQNESPKHIILVTDGGENCDESPCEYVMNLIKTRKDVKIDVIAINIDNIDDLDQLKCTANVTSGKLYNVNTEAELKRSFDETITNRKKVNALIVK